MAEAARILGVSELTVRTWEKAGRISPQRIGGPKGVRVFERSELERIAAERQAKAAAR